MYDSALEATVRPEVPAEAPIVGVARSRRGLLRRLAKPHGLQMRLHTRIPSSTTWNSSIRCCLSTRFGGGSPLSDT